jgi:protein-L-isoaspartate(D-aspartate) O-methyltransferase
MIPLSSLLPTRQRRDYTPRFTPARTLRILPSGRHDRELFSMTSYVQQRRAMVTQQLERRGISDPRVLDAMATVPRELFVPEELRRHAYEDGPLPIEEGQTISQPYIVALMVEALVLRGGERVLEIGAGSGYAAAVIGAIAEEVYAIERHGPLVQRARERLADAGVDNARVVHADGTLGWPEAAPYDAVIVAAGGPDVPPALVEQLRPGGRLVIPIGDRHRGQTLVRLTKGDDGALERENLGEVRFVPLIGESGWEDPDRPAPAPRRAIDDLPAAIADASEPFGRIDEVRLDALLDRIGEARVVLLGEASHGTAEFYRMRARITRELIERKGFGIVAVEADWPDAARIDHYVRDLTTPPAEWRAFTRFPTWMWRNTEVQEFADWLRQSNASRATERRVAFYGLDLYSLYTSIEAVLGYLDEIDPESAKVARERYACLTPWRGDPAFYGQATFTGRYRECEQEAVSMLSDLLAKRMEYAFHDGERFVDAVQNARLVASAERYYRTMYFGAVESWNLRDQHMFDTLRTLLEFHGPQSRAVVWAHNSHLGDASATEMGARGEHNVGQLCREAFGDGAYLVGFGTHTGQVAAASAWGGDMEVKTVRPSHENSYERVCHDAAVPAFLLALRHAPGELREALASPRLERAIGVIYRPETELASHYFEARLPDQFDEFVWFDRTAAVRPLDAAELGGVPDTYPFAL